MSLKVSIAISLGFHALIAVLIAGLAEIKPLNGNRTREVTISLPELEFIKGRNIPTEKKERLESRQKILNNATKRDNEDRKPGHKLSASEPVHRIQRSHNKEDDIKKIKDSGENDQKLVPERTDIERNSVNPLNSVYSSINRQQSEITRTVQSIDLQKIEVIREIISKSIRYPRRAVILGLEGRVELTFTITETGEVKDIRILKSSGYEILDRAALEALNRSQDKFPNVNRDLRVTVPLNFTLR